VECFTCIKSFIKSTITLVDRSLQQMVRAGLKAAARGLGTVCRMEPATALLIPGLFA
jgi:hypothetical protein